MIATPWESETLSITPALDASLEGATTPRAISHPRDIDPRHPPPGRSDHFGSGVHCARQGSTGTPARHNCASFLIPGGAKSRSFWVECCPSSAGGSSLPAGSDFEQYLDSRPRGELIQLGPKCWGGDGTGSLPTGCISYISLKFLARSRGWRDSL